ncbi:HIT domain-containing protein [Neptunicella marina]|uniref:HIT domain-containing protein n=1 Tax=Neptunicella marina TaxID=2125989 RepID=A0A8J6IRM4_9ALTE|nr:HIT family protein [Neptunicella marina]MBC3764336.1 HIT domain-containing protein [Neptunicella marina]
MEFRLHPQLERDSLPITTLPLSEVRLINDSQYPWVILVPRVPDISECIDLSAELQQMLFWESSYICQMLRTVFKPDKLNVAAIGNMVPQLHLHHIARYKQDAGWPKPVWGQLPMQAYSSDEARQCIYKIEQYFQHNNFDQYKENR